MRLILPVSLLFCTLLSTAQEHPPTIVFSGYIFSEDSVPAENVHVINYRDTKIVMTDSTGHFTIFAEEGDSLMINHISLQAKVIYANGRKATANRFYVPYRAYQLRSVATHHFARDYHHFEQNIKKLNSDLQKLGYIPPEYKGNDNNPYNPDKENLGLTISLGEIIRLFKRKK